MFPDFPNFFGNLHYFLKGKTLAMFRKAIYEQMPIAGNGITLQETEDGIIVSSKQGRATATASVIDFTGVLSGDDVIIQGGKVLGVSWSTYMPNNPSSGGWTESVTGPVRCGAPMPRCAGVTAARSLLRGANTPW